MGENCIGKSAQEIMEDLKKPFAPEDIEWRVQRSMFVNNEAKAIVCAYVDNRAIQNRLDEVVGPFNWKNEFSEWRQKGVLCGISIKFDSEWVTKYDAADETNIESTKGGISASSKRTASAWGIGRYLYKIEEVWVTVNEKKKTQKDVYFNAEIKQGNQKKWVKGYWTPPTLPSWALPEGYNPPEQQQKPQTQGNQGGQNNSSSQGRSQQGNEQNQQQGNQEYERNKLISLIEKFEAQIGLKEKPNAIVRIFNKANPDFQIKNPMEIGRANNVQLSNYYLALRPVNDILIVSQKQGVSMEQVLTFAQIVKPQIKVENIFSLFFNVFKEDSIKIIQMINAEAQQRRTA